jgi:chorismate lyase/3-hydroxybenzoate synthase
MRWRQELNPLPLEGSDGPFAVDYIDEASINDVVASDRLLAAIRFGQESLSLSSRVLTIPLPPIGHRPIHGPIIEIWRSPGPVETGDAGLIHYASNDTVVLGHCTIDESSSSGLGSATYTAYRSILAFCRTSGFPHLSRMWNYFPGINAPGRSTERYQEFCRGRYLALARSRRYVERHLPAACAIGTQASPLIICFLASRIRGRQIENPRQVSAFLYPKRYSPKSPAFSRSLLVSWRKDLHQLFISGTASIVGHATVHADNLQLQLEETFRNLQALKATADRFVTHPFRLQLLKVYVRDGARAAEVFSTLSSCFASGIPTLVLQGEICRRDLMIEVEGMAVSDGSPSSGR